MKKNQKAQADSNIMGDGILEVDKELSHLPTAQPARVLVGDIIGIEWCLIYKRHVSTLSPWPLEQRAKGKG